MTGKSKGYAFVEYEHESDAHAAYRVRFPLACATYAVGCAPELARLTFTMAGHAR